MHSSAASIRKPALGVAAFVLGALAIVLLLVYGPGPHRRSASSHAEAPLIGQDPRADNTDLYAFVSPENTNTVTMIANYIPLEAPASGPNFYSFDDSVLYEIKIDNDGDGDGGHRLPVPLHDADPERRTRSSTTPARSRRSTTRTGTGRRPTASRSSTSRRTARSRRAARTSRSCSATNIPTPPVNIGPRSTPNYDALAAAAVTTLPGGIKVFAGQRDDPFYVDLGSVFDLAGLRPFNPFHLIPLGRGAGRDALKNYNTHSIEIQVPIDQLVQIPNTTVGIYASASRAEGARAPQRRHDRRPRRSSCRSRGSATR